MVQLAAKVAGKAISFM